MGVYNQKSFAGGMNLRVDDTRLANDEYRAAFNCRNRVDTLEPILQSVEDPAAPAGLKQGILTFGEYIIIFLAGYAYYRHYTATGWVKIDGFRMNTTAPRYWYEEIPVALTIYKRSLDATAATTINNGIVIEFVEGASQGNLSGLLVQDNINQPQFIYLDDNGYVKCRTTQDYSQWSVDWAAYTAEKDKREYVPIGNAMKYVDGILYIVNQQKTKLLRSVSGRPLDFVVNVTVDGDKGGDADTTAYSVGVGRVQTLHSLADGSLFVGAGNANFAISKNMTPNAPTIFGEYTFIRRFLFNATCLDDRCVIDTLGDTRFIDLGGIRSFNAILQQQNEGRNSIFSIKLNAALGQLRQSQGSAAAIYYDNYELYAINTIFGNVIAVYDSVNEIWVAFDTNQARGSAIKQFAKIELDIQRLFAITDDNKLYTLYSSDSYDIAAVRPPSVNANTINPETENLLQQNVKPVDFRAVLNGITEDCTASLTTFVDNRLTDSIKVKNISFTESANPYDGQMDLPDVDTQLSNLYWTMPNAALGWKCFYLLSWTGGAALTQIAATVKVETPMNPLATQSNVR